MVSTDDIRQTTRLGFRKDLNWVSLPHRFPFDKWEEPQSWAEQMAAVVYYVGRGQFDDSRPTVEWFIRTHKFIEASRLNFLSVKNRYKCLLFHDVDALPAFVSIDAFLGDPPWAEAQDIYVKAHHDEIVEGPRVEPFDMPGAEAAVRIIYFMEADPESHALAADYNYAFRSRGIDVLVRASIIDLGLIRDAVPVLEEFVRGITVNFDSPE